MKIDEAIGGIVGSILFGLACFALVFALSVKW